MGRDTDLIIFDDKKYQEKVVPLLNGLFLEGIVFEEVDELLKSEDYFSDMQGQISQLLQKPEIYPWIDKNYFSAKVCNISIDNILNHFQKSLAINFEESFKTKYGIGMGFFEQTENQRILIMMVQDLIPYYCWNEDFLLSTYPHEDSIWYSRRDANILRNFLVYYRTIDRKPDISVVNKLVKLCYRWFCIANHSFDSDSGGPYGWLSRSEVKELAMELADYDLCLMPTIKDIRSGFLYRNFCLERGLEEESSHGWNRCKLSKLYSMCRLASARDMGLAFYLSG